MKIDPTEAIENEWYIVRYSGETPEIAYNSAIYQLSRAKDGPRLYLDEEQVGLLKSAAVARYTEIILRDLQHANCTKPIYRGIDRSIVNYQRFSTFCERQQLDVSDVRRRAAEALLVFLETEIKLVQDIHRQSIINCTYEDLQNFAVLLGLDFGDSLTALESHCQLSS